MQTLLDGLTRTVKSVVEIDPQAGSVLSLFPHVQERISVLGKSSSDDGVEYVSTPFMQWTPQRKFPVMICLNAMHRIRRVDAFAQRLLKMSHTLVISVPFNQAKGKLGSVHNSIDETMLLEWFGRTPNFSYVSREIGSQSDMLIQVYEKDPDPWKTLAERNRLRIERSRRLAYSEINARGPIGETDLSQFHRSLKTCDGIADFKRAFEKSDSSYSIRLNETILDMEIYVRDPRKVVFCLTGAADRNKVVSPPCFTMRTLASSLEASCVFISDPSFYLSRTLTLGWYGGSAKDPLQTILPDIMRFIIERLGCQRTMFFGGSGGGFASLFYSRLIPESLALIWNPQTILANYYESSVNAYAETAFHTPGSELSQHIVADIPAFYAQTPGSNRVVYMQNLTDPHVERHLVPFLQSKNIALPDGLYSGWIDPNIYLHLTNWTDGHTPPPRKVLQSLMGSFSDPEQDWADTWITQEMARTETMAAN